MTPAPGHEKGLNMTYDARGAWRIALLLLVFMLTNFFDKVVVGLLAAPIMNELQLTPVQFGLVGSSFFWLFALGGIVGGFIGNRVATRWVLLAMALAWSLCQVPLILKTSFSMFIVARVALGFTEGPAYPVAVHAAFKWFPPHKRIVPVSLFGTGAGLGLLIAGVTVPFVTRHWGWRANFVLLGVLALAWSAVWLAFGKEGPIDDHQPANCPRPRIAWRRLLTDSTVVATMLMQFASYWAIALSFTWLPAYFEKGLGLGPDASAHLYALTIATATPLGITASFGAQRLFARGVSLKIAHGWSTAAYQLTAAAMFACLSVPHLPHGAPIVLILLAMAFNASSYAKCPAILGEVSPSAQRSAVLAIGNSIASVAGILAPLITGRLIQANAGVRGYELAFGLCGALLAIGAIAGAMLVDPECSVRRLFGTPVAGEIVAQSESR